jgi:hypothetical protein
MNHRLPLAGEKQFEPLSADVLLVLHVRFNMVTQAQLHHLFDYNPETGIFTRKVKTSNSVKVGDIAGSDNGNKYIKFCVNSKLEFAHRMAWLYVYGLIPKGNIDHINGNPSDNRISNLRLVNQSQNMQNTNKWKTNTSGYKGVTWAKDKNKWVAQIWKNHKRHYLGSFDESETAYKAYCEAAIKMHTHNKVTEEYTKRVEMKL